MSEVPVFGHKPSKYSKEPCPQCGMLLLLVDLSCERCYNKKPVIKVRQPKSHGKSNSPNKYYNYEQGVLRDSRP